MKNWIRHLLERLGCIPRTEFVATVAPDYPDASALSPGVMHVVGDKHYRKWAYFNCPCGCGEPIMLSLSTKRRPQWKLEIDWLNRPSIEPSVWQTDGCYSHFWVKKGHIVWTGDTGKSPSRSQFAH